ncbi:hypothetical protein K466DRAFT_96817 [Polyporus arcularius HHB13444]|uniref:Uncharacterized protein n=1 Tax=Polyporus arcularius HHB13444 TaxID=1314778 RepID=A0A5C3PG30_9APHY|nr:hypothetical protein K466DRAFT_96817 [Polyporus arcularius HHB13444]
MTTQGSALCICFGWLEERSFLSGQNEQNSPRKVPVYHVGHTTKSLPRLTLCILGSSVCCVSFDTSFGRIRLLTASRSGRQSPRSSVQASPAVTSPFMNILMMFAVDMPPANLVRRGSLLRSTFTSAICATRPVHRKRHNSDHYAHSVSEVRAYDVQHLTCMRVGSS